LKHLNSSFGGFEIVAIKFKSIGLMVLKVFALFTIPSKVYNFTMHNHSSKLPLSSTLSIFVFLLLSHSYILELISQNKCFDNNSKGF
jgi:hypothetical protein